MRHAATLLTATPMTVETVVQRVGYDNPFAFSVAFKRRMQAAPPDYRKTAGRDA
jgi:transcriptional regulator GlxA family with amidase domain